MAATPLQLPEPLEYLINTLGRTFPSSDEVRMGQFSERWFGFGDQIKARHQQGAEHAEAVSGTNQGHDIDAFQQKFADRDAGPEVVKDGAISSMAISGGLLVGAAVVLMLKVYQILHLNALFVAIQSAIASAAATFGASLAAIPIFEHLTDMAIGLLIDLAISVLS